MFLSKGIILNKVVPGLSGVKDISCEGYKLLDYYVGSFAVPVCHPYMHTDYLGDKHLNLLLNDLPVLHIRGVKPSIITTFNTQ